MTSATTASGISVIIRTYTEARWNYLVAALHSLETQTLLPSEVVVLVDNNPALMEKVRQEFPKVVVVPNQYTRGSSGAWNSAVAAARYPIIAFMDDDAKADPDWLEHLTAPYADPKVVGVGGTIDPIWAAGRPQWFPSEFQWVVGCTYTGMPETLAPIRNLIGCNMSLLRIGFEEIGGFRTEMGHRGARPNGCDETELCIRLRQHWPDKVLLQEPKATVRHMVPAARSTFRYFMSRCYLEGQGKALTAHAVGANDGLASERAYTFKTLPSGVLTGIKDTLRGDVWGLGRASAIIIGLGITAVSYAWGKLRLNLANQRFSKPPTFAGNDTSVS